jgi:hypothetical protein
MALTVWRIGFAAATCDRCGRTEERRERPNGYAVMLVNGWREEPDDDVDGVLRLGPGPPRLVCPDCAGAASAADRP